MRFEPKKSQVVGRLAATRVSDLIAAPNEVKQTKFVMLEELSEEAVNAGYKSGDLVVSRVINHIWLKGGHFHRAVLPIDEIVCVIHDVPLEELIDINGNPFRVQEAAA